MKLKLSFVLFSNAPLKLTLQMLRWGYFWIYFFGAFRAPNPTTNVFALMQKHWIKRSSRMLYSG
jgi:hypothetical protein